MKPVIRHMSSFLNAPSLSCAGINSIGFRHDMAVSYPVKKSAMTALRRTNLVLVDQHRVSLQPDPRIKILATSLFRPPDPVLKKSGGTGGNVASISP